MDTNAIALMMLLVQVMHEGGLGPEMGKFRIRSRSGEPVTLICSRQCGVKIIKHVCTKRVESIKIFALWQSGPPDDPKPSADQKAANFLVSIIMRNL